MLRLHLHWTQAMSGGVARGASLAVERAASRVSAIAWAPRPAAARPARERLVQRLFRTSSVLTSESMLSRHATRVFRIAQRIVGARDKVPAPTRLREQANPRATSTRYALAPRRYVQATSDAPTTTPTAATKRRSPDLVWRKPPTPQPHAALVEPATRNTWQAPATHTPLAAVGAPPPTRADATHEPSATAPDFVDRVANDVLRRIDHRLRIERERRGM
jgi:hypothetical protein